MTIKSTDEYWKEVQTIGAHEYSLENTQVVSNSDGGASAEKFQEAFLQSCFPHVHQLDEYHIQQTINRTFGYKQNKWKDKVREAIKQSNLDRFTLVLDTYESRLEDEKSIEKVDKFRTYILHRWDYVLDWQKRIDDAPKGARG